MILMATTCWVLLSMPLNTSPKLPFPIRSCFVNISSGSTFCEQIPNYLPSDENSDEKVTTIGGGKGVEGVEGTWQSSPRFAALFAKFRGDVTTAKVWTDFTEKAFGNKRFTKFRSTTRNRNRHGPFLDKLFKRKSAPIELLRNWKKSRLLDSSYLYIARCYIKCGKKTLVERPIRYSKHSFAPSKCWNNRKAWRENSLGIELRRASILVTRRNQRFRGEDPSTWDFLSNRTSFESRRMQPRLWEMQFSLAPF